MGLHKADKGVELVAGPRLVTRGRGARGRSVVPAGHLWLLRVVQAAGVAVTNAWPHVCLLTRSRLVGLPV